jgi:cell fate regulator YaaT (PSP1 superfamily)
MESLGKVSLFTKGCVVCALPPDALPARGDKCILELDYGVDVGTYMGSCACTAHPEDDPAATGARRPRILRMADERDLKRIQQNAADADQLMSAFVALVAESGQVIKPLMAHFTFNRERLLIVFGSPDYIDCRRAVGILQREHNTRVEVRHVNVRDEASVAGGIGSCGRPLCCATWLRVFRPVNVRMVKTQDLSLNPVAINGCCGRLKCCMRFEYEVYQEAAEGLPETGMRVLWQSGECVVVGRDVLNRTVLIRTPDHGLRHVPVDELSRTADSAARPVTKEMEHEDPSGERPEPGPVGEA